MPRRGASRRGRQPAGAPADGGAGTAPSSAADSPSDAILLERRRIARELHDGPVQSLWFLGAEIRRLRGQAAGATAELRAGLEALQATWAQVYEEFRQVLRDLHQPLLATNTLVGMLEQALAGLQQAGLATELCTDLAPHHYPLDRAAEAQLARICQAALGNVQRHARAKRVRVALRVGATETLLTIEDDGVGFDPDEVCGRTTAHFGLAMMRERAASLGGQFEVRSAPGQGTCLVVRVPHPAA